MNCRDIASGMVSLVRPAKFLFRKNLELRVKLKFCKSCDNLLICKRLFRNFSKYKTTLSGEVKSQFHLLPHFDRAICSHHRTSNCPCNTSEQKLGSLQTVTVFQCTSDEERIFTCRNVGQLTFSPFYFLTCFTPDYSHICLHFLSAPPRGVQPTP